MFGIGASFGEGLGRQAHLGAQLKLGIANGDHALVAELHGGDHVGVADFLGGAFDHHGQVAAADIDEVQVGSLELLLGGVEDELAIHAAHAHGADGAEEGQLAEHQGGGSGVDAEDVAFVFAVGGHQRVVDLDIIEEALGEERADGAIGDAGGQDFLFGGAAFALEIPAGETAGGIEPLAVFHLQGEEINAFAGLAGGGDGRKDHGLAELASGLAGGLAGEQARFECHGFAAEIHGDGGGVLHLASFLLFFFLLTDCFFDV